MDILIGIGSSIIEKAAEYTLEPVARQIGYFFHYKRNVDNLRIQIEDLKLAKERIDNSVNLARRTSEKIEGDVQNWLSKVETISEAAEKLLPRDDGQVSTGCSSGSFRMLIKKYKLSKEAKKTAQVIAQIKEAGNFSKISYYLAPNMSFKIKGYEAFETRSRTVVDIMEALRDDDVRMIGVWGMGGVGKTMLVKEVARQAKNENLFNQVVLTSVSQTLDCRKVQEEVADNLGLLLQENSISIRAKRLNDHLRNVKKTLIILDDIWSKLDLEAVGICFNDDQKECKIMLTSRSKDVLLNEMGVDRSFELRVLYESEAASLFNHIVGDVTDDNELRNLKGMIVKECAGLPLAISVVANALKNKRIPSWKNALQELRASNPVNVKGVEKEVYSVIKLSYNFLESEEAKSLLLLCSLHKEDEEIDVNELVTYGMGLTLFHGIQKLEDARNKAFHMVENLKTSSLLLDGLKDNYVKMHDVIRDVVLSIASKERHMYFISNVKINEMLNSEELENSTAISCLFSDINDPLPERLLCPNLQLFSLQSFQYENFQIPNHFFNGENKLQVLHLSRVEWNLSFQFLKNLKTLILSGSLLGDIALVGELTSLEILNLSRSDIKAVPVQLGKLTRLRSLDLSNCYHLEFIAHGVISNLKLLEEFSAQGSFTGWAACEEVCGESSNASLGELKQLRHLTTLDLEITNAPNVVPNGLFNDKIENYEIIIGSSSSKQFFQREEASRSLVLEGVSCSLLEQSGLENLIIKAERLRIRGVESMSHFFLKFSDNGLSRLKVLDFGKDATCRYIIDRHSNISCFQSLEELYLVNLTNLETICNSGELSGDSFTKLRVIVVRDCHSLKNLFPLPAACRQLEKIKVTRCNALEGIFTYNENSGEAKDMIEFPRLRCVKLRYLPKLMQFYEGLSTTERRDEGQLNSDDMNLQPLFNRKVAFPNLLKLDLVSLNRLGMIWQGDGEFIADSCCKLEKIHIQDCSNLRNVLPSNLLRNLTSLTELEVNFCDKVEDVFEIKRCTTCEESNIPFTSLMLPKLKKVSVACKSLKSLFPESIAKGLVHLESLEISNCDQIQQVIAKEEEALDTIPKFDFSKLTTLILARLPNLEAFYSGLHSSEWASLTSLNLN